MFTNFPALLNDLYGWIINSYLIAIKLLNHIIYQLYRQLAQAKFNCQQFYFWQKKTTLDIVVDYDCAVHLLLIRMNNAAWFMTKTQHSQGADVCKFELQNKWLIKKLQYTFDVLATHVACLCF